MAGEKLYFKLDFNIHEGKLATFEQTAKTMIDGTKKKSGALGYEWFLSEDRKSCRLLETYANADAMLAHMNETVVRELLPKLLESATLAKFEVYGEPGAEARGMLARSGAVIYAFRRGLGR
jgi:quinol monooxygenase YgiN